VRQRVDVQPGPGARDGAVAIARPLVLLAACGAALGACAGAGRAPDVAPPRVRVLAYNVRHGAGLDGRIDLARAAAVIRAARPDVVCLQEVDAGCARTGGVDQARALGALCGMESVFGPFMDYDGGRYGMAVLARRPILASENLRLPPGAEPRSALAVRVRVGAGRGAEELVVVGIHLYRTEAERLAQARELARRLADERAPVVLAGDFNSEPGSPVLAELVAAGWTVLGKGADRLTFPADAPEREIDFVLVRPAERFRVRAMEVLPEPLASDHRPILLEAQLVGPAAGRAPAAADGRSAAR
jgi:endonuclease/exonuclease/phosphatase family metal-dependent hydrolase